MFVFYLVLAAMLGILLSLVFFGGLWWTTKRLTFFKSPYLAFAVSFLLRAALVLLGLFLILQTGRPYLVAALVGLVLGRTFLISQLKLLKGGGQKVVD